MRPLRRGGVNKRKSSAKFRKHSRHTKAPNVKGPMRGGIRF